jgi:hypothetical protein
MDSNEVLRQQLLALLRGGNAHMDVEQAVADFPLEAINTRPPNVPYTPWHLLEHIRIAQWDILEFVRNPHHISPQWPEGYWPHPEAQADETKWKATIAAIQADLRAVQHMAEDSKTDLTAPLPHAQDYTVLRELLLVADHNAYHVGEFAILRQVMGTWPES